MIGGSIWDAFDDLQNTLICSSLMLTNFLSKLLSLLSVVEILFLMRLLYENPFEHICMRGATPLYAEVLMSIVKDTMCSILSCNLYL